MQDIVRYANLWLPTQPEAAPAALAAAQQSALIATLWPWQKLGCSRDRKGATMPHCQRHCSRDCQRHTKLVAGCSLCNGFLPPCHQPDLA